MILVIDVGTTGLRAAIVRDDATVGEIEYRAFAPESPFPGLVEFDADRMAALVRDAASATLARSGGGRVRAVGLATQRASTIVWERATGRPIGPALGWQDLRTVGECLTLNGEHGVALAPNQSATKIGWLLANAGAGRDPAELCAGTVDSWLAWCLTDGSVHVTDHTNAAVTGLYSLLDRAWDTDVCELLGIDPAMLPRLVDSTEFVGDATVLDGAPSIGALVGDQQASLVGQGCVEPGRAKITFGTGGMLDVCTGPDATPAVAARSEHGTFPIVAWSSEGRSVWGVEAIMLSAGSNVEWLVEDLAIIDSAADSHEVASQTDGTDGVVYVPALLGLGTPQWDYGARGTLLGVTRGTRRPHVVRAVLEGIAQRGADLVEATEAETGHDIPALRVDGGMTANPTFLRALADATGKVVEVAPVADATTLGAGLLAGVTAGAWSDVAATAETWRPAVTVEPGTPLDRAAWRRAIERALAWHPDLSALDF